MKEKVIIDVPLYVQKAIDCLKEDGYSAYIVGGCVRDSLLGVCPYDYDITTNALPEDIIRVFSGEKMFDAGLKHGTVSVVLEGNVIEITTYRIDGEYIDSRRPERVEFTDKIEQDLARRDFTVNAMAYSREIGIVDCFWGKSDLEKRLVRCVGDADVRFSEDALRIMRALRFASVLGFDIEADTSQSIHKNKNLLKNIAAERIRDEFFKLICGSAAEKILREYRDVIAVFIPQIEQTFDFEQKSVYHNLDVYSHCVRAMIYAKPEPHLRMSALLHDIGKPACFTLDENGCGHMYKHAAKSAQMAREILNSLKCDNEIKHKVITLIEKHDLSIMPDRKNIKKWLGKLGEDMFFDLLEIKKADTYAQTPDITEKRIKEIEKIKEIAADVILEGECFSLKNLAVDGHDMIELGLDGKKIGEALSYLLEGVIESRFINGKEYLISEIKNREDIK